MGKLYIHGAYNIPNIRFVSKVCKTNLPSNGAFRGFGGPQHIFIAENILQRVAQHIGKSPYMVRLL